MSELPTPQTIKIDDMYRETCNTIRATDDISLKLLGFVPVFAGSAAGLLAKNANEMPLSAIALFVVVGISATIGLYAWERRNIETCKFYRDRRDALEEKHGVDKFGDQKPPTLFGARIGKTGAERLLYGASILSWLIPLVVSCPRFCAVLCAA